MILKCNICKKDLNICPADIRAGRKHCSHKCARVAQWSNPEIRKKLCDGRKGKGTASKVFTEEHKLNISLSKKGSVPWNKGKKLPQLSGTNHPFYIEDRSLIKGTQNRNNPEYKQWRQKVWLRDNFTCKIANPDCAGRIEAHHILGWAEYSELRYQINNGITLCHAHHPRKRAEEKRLIPTFQELVSVSNKTIGRS